MKRKIPANRIRRVYPSAPFDVEHYIRDYFRMNDVVKLVPVTYVNYKGVVLTTHPA